MISRKYDEAQSGYPHYEVSCVRYRRYTYGPEEGWINKDGVDLEEFLTKDEKIIFEDVTRHSGKVIEALVGLMDSVVSNGGLDSYGRPKQLVRALELAGVQGQDARAIASKALTWRLCGQP